MSEAFKRGVDSREKLEAEMAEYLERDWYMLAPGLLEKMGGWLDRQAAITKKECADFWQEIAEDRDKAQMECTELTELANDLEHQRDEWKDLARKWKAKSDEWRERAMTPISGRSSGNGAVGFGIFDSREDVERDAGELVADYAASGEVCDPMYNGIIELLDRQAAITERESERLIIEQQVGLAERDRRIVEYAEEVGELERRLEAAKRAIAKAGCLFTEENGEIAVVLPSDEFKQPDDYRAAYHEVCHQREEYREKLSRALDLAHEIGRIAEWN